MLADQTFLFNLDAQLVFDTALLAVSVFVLFLVMSYLLFNPARKFFKDRQNRIANDIDAAKKDREEAAALKAEYEEKLHVAQREADAILSEARQKAMHNQFMIVSQGKAEAERIVNRAKEEALLEKKHALDDMKQEMVAVASLMAQKVVAANIDATVQDTLVEETLKEMGDSTWLS